jgi:GDP-L-fucose synthase
MTPIKKILLTGASGMVGRNILEHPQIDTYEMLAPRRVEVDLTDYHQVEDYLQYHQPDMIIHAAGRVGGIQANVAEPTAFLMDNMAMGCNIVNAARAVGIKKLLNLGSSCMYPRNGINPLVEESILCGQLEPTNEGYALAKVVTLRLCEYSHREDPSFEYKTLIPCNLYGRYDKFDPQHSHLIPAIIHKVYQAIQQNQTVVDIWGDGTARREFMYAGDLADVIIRAVTQFDSLPYIMNVGLGFDYTINDYYQAVAAILGYSGQFVHDVSKPVGMARKLVSIEKQTQWGWSAQRDLQAGLCKTIEFYLQSVGTVK